MTDQIEYKPAENGTAFYAYYNGEKIGEITFVLIGADKMILDHTGVNEKFRGNGIGRGLVQQAVELARNQHRKILPFCPFAQTIFNKSRQFDDIRLMNAN